MSSSSNIVERDHRKERETKIKRMRDEILEIIKNTGNIAKDWCKYRILSTNIMNKSRQINDSTKNA